MSWVQVSGEFGADESAVEQWHSEQDLSRLHGSSPRHYIPRMRPVWAETPDTIVRVERIKDAARIAYACPPGADTATQLALTRSYLHSVLFRAAVMREAGGFFGRLLFRLGERLQGRRVFEQPALQALADRQRHRVVGGLPSAFGDLT